MWSSKAMNLPEKPLPEPINMLIERYTSCPFYHDRGTYIGPSGAVKFETKFVRQTGFVFTWGHVDTTESHKAVSRVMQHMLVSVGNESLYKGLTSKHLNKCEPILGVDFSKLDQDVVNFVPQVALPVLLGASSIPIHQANIAVPASLVRVSDSVLAKYRAGDDCYSILLDSSSTIRKVHRLVVVGAEIMTYVSQLSPGKRNRKPNCEPIIYEEQVVFESTDFNTEIDLADDGF